MEYGVSVFPIMPDDRQALVFTPEAFGASPDGTGDNTAALQAAVDAVVARMGQGILFIPELSIPFGSSYHQ